jgi:hypothetical protein
MQTSPILLIHIGGGLSGLLSGAAAMLFRKGSRRHRVAGDVFVISMMIMAVAAVYLALLKHDTGNIIGGGMTFYFVSTAWLTARRREGGTGVFDWVALAFPLTLAAIMLLNGFRIASGATKSNGGVPLGMYFFLGSIALLSAAGDIRMLARGLTGTQRLVRHLWRMCFALFIASGSFFLGPANRPLRFAHTLGLKQQVFALLLSMNTRLALGVLPLMLMIFWMVRVKFTHRYGPRKQSAAQVKVIDGIVLAESTSPGLSVMAK